MLVTSCFQERPSSSTVSVSVRVVPKNWRQGWLSFASCRFDIVTVLHFAAPKRTFQEVAHFSMLHKSWFKDAAAGILSSLDLMKLMSVTSSAYRMEVLDISKVISSMKMMNRRGPRIEPWGTPALMNLVLEDLPFKMTFIARFLK